MLSLLYSVLFFYLFTPGLLHLLHLASCKFHIFSIVPIVKFTIFFYWLHYPPEKFLFNPSFLLPLITNEIVYIYENKFTKYKNIILVSQIIVSQAPYYSIIFPLELYINIVEFLTNCNLKTKV